MPARLHLLGAPHVVDDGGHRHDLVLERPTALLVLLALRGDWVRRTELAALVRPDAADDEAHAYLRKLIFRARKQPWATDLEADAGRVRWRVASDVAAFRDAVARGDDPAALAAYGGPLLDGADLPAAEALRAWLDVERAELAATWRSVVLRHAAAREAAGDLPAAEAALERLRVRDPLDEEAVQVLVRVQLAAGRPRAAWSAFETLRAALEAELGVAPLEATLALADLARPAAAAVAGAASHVGGQPGATPFGGPAGRVAGAPPVDGPLVGRAEVLERVAGWWARGDVRWVTLAGLGGAGKTRLAVEIARSAAPPRVAAFVACAGRASLVGVATALAEALDVDVGGRAAPHEALTAWWRDRPVVVVLDDLDRTLAADVAAWLAASPTVAAVATARAPFDLPGEWLVDVGGLPVPAEDARDVAASEAVQLFLALAERRAAIPVSGRDGLAAVARLCRRVGGLPLALELAAAWTRVAPVEALLARMDEDVAVLRVAAPEVPDRHRDLVAVLDATLDLLEERERSALGRLAAFETAFSAAAAARVAEVGLALLLRTVNLGLVGRTADGTYRLHPFVREVAWGRLPEALRAEAGAAVRAHAATVVAAAADAMLRHDEAAGLRALRPELDLLRTAWRDAVDVADDATLAAMEAGLYLAWDARAAYHEGFDAFASAAVARAGTDAALARRLEARTGYFALRLGRTDEARRRLEAALAGADGADAGFAVHNLGVLDLFAGRHDAARQRFVDAHERYAALGDAWGTSRAANNLAALGQFTGDAEGAETWGRRALAESRSLGNQRGVAAAANNLGSALEARGAWDEAERAYHEALELYASVHDPRGEAAAWTNLGHLAERRGDDAEAAAAYERGLQLKRGLGDPLAIAVSLANLAEVCVRRGEAPRARAMVHEALRIAVAADADTYVARTLLTHARERAHSGDVGEAIRVAVALAGFTTAEAWVRAEAEAALARWTTVAPVGPPAEADATVAAVVERALRAPWNAGGTQPL